MFGFFEQKANDLWNVVAPEASETAQFLSTVSSGSAAQVESLMLRDPNQFNLNVCDPKQNRPVHIACKAGNVPVAEFLLSKGADPAMKGENGNNCLHLAAMSGNSQLVKLFIEEFNLSVASKNYQGRNVYDVAQGFSLKQFLLPLVLKEQSESNGSAPLLGVSRDAKADEERLKNLAPPPTGPALISRKPPQLKSTPNTFRPIEENDGFGTTVGNPELAAKYGNKSNYKSVSLANSDCASSVSAGSQSHPNSVNLDMNPPMVAPKIAARGVRSRPKYVPYAPTMGSNGPSRPVGVNQPVRKVLANPAVRSEASSKVKVFNPALRLAKK